VIRRIQLGLLFALMIAAGARSHPSPLAPEQEGNAREILARARLFAGIGPGVSALRRDSAGRYFILAAPANAIAIYGPGGQRLGQIPNAHSRGAAIHYAQDLDLDASGRVFVADRGANAVEIFDPDGSLRASIPVEAPTSVVALSDDEMAVAALQSPSLVGIFDVRGKLLRNFGSPPTLGPNQLKSWGKIYGDPAGSIYFVFADLPDPTIRKYDRFGYVASEITLLASEFASPAEAKDWKTVTIEKSEGASSTKPVIDAFAVDPENQDIWMAVGDELLQYDKDGGRRAAYHTMTREGVRIAPTALLIEHDRILVGCDPLGVFDFATPDPRPPAAPSR
jgi:hypothetical protein